MLSKLFWAITGPLLFSIQLALANDAPSDSFTVVDLEWALPVDPKNSSSETITVTGTIQDTMAKMEALHPGWNKTFISSIPPPPSTMLRSRAERESFKCGEPWYNTARQSIIDGANYLRGLNSAPPKNGPGPGNCGRVSCSYGGAIWWCNENNFEKQVTWQEIGDSAYFLAYQCGIWNDITWLTAGEEFFKDKWSVYVTATAC